MTDPFPIVQAANRYNIFGHWGRRRETFEALATRWISLITQLQALDSSSLRWFHWDLEQKRPVTFDPTPGAQIARLSAAAETTPEGKLLPEAGVRISNIRGPFPRSRCLRVSAFAGNDNPYQNNDLDIETDPFAVPDADVVSFPMFRIALLAAAEAYDVTQAYAFPVDLMNFWSPDRSKASIPLSWISYVAPRFAPLVTPPPRAIVERRPDGGLLMAATDATFRTDDPAHLAVARDIEAALAPFNALPWTAETGK